MSRLLFAECFATALLLVKFELFTPKTIEVYIFKYFIYHHLSWIEKLYNIYVKYFFFKVISPKKRKSISSWSKYIIYIIKTWFIIVVFYYFDFRETGSIILATNKIFYSLGPNVYVVLFLLYSNICQRMSENWNRFLKYKQNDLDRFHRNSLLNRFSAWSMINLLSVWSIYKIKTLNYFSFLRFNQ